MLDEQHALPSQPVDETRSPDIGPASTPQHDAAADDELTLTAALAAELSRKPRRSQPATHPIVTADDDTLDDTSVIATAARRSYVSALRHQTSTVPIDADFLEDASDDDAGEAIAPAGAVSWFTAARRRTWRRNLKAAGAWVATVAIGTAIIAVAAVLLFDGPRNLEALLDLAYGPS